MKRKNTDKLSGKTLITIGLVFAVFSPVIFMIASYFFTVVVCHSEGDVLSLCPAGSPLFAAFVCFAWLLISILVIGLGTLRISKNPTVKTRK